MTISYSPTQTIVTFLPSVSSTEPAKRVFDFEVSQNTVQAYSNVMTILDHASRGELWSGSAWVTAPTTADQMAVVQECLRMLNSWSQKKYVDSAGVQQENASYSYTPGTTVSGLSDYMSYALQGIPGATFPFTPDTTLNRYMAESVDKLIRTIRTAGQVADPSGIGWDPITDPFDAEYAAIALDRAKNLSYTDPSTGQEVLVYDLLGVISSAQSVCQSAVITTDAFSQSQSIQQLLMVDYIARGNDLLYKEMDQLREAINLNQEVLSYMNSLQDLMNQKDPEHFLMKLQLLNSTKPDYAQFEKETYDQELGNVPKFTDDELAVYVTTLHIESLGLDPNDPAVREQYGLPPPDTNIPDPGTTSQTGEAAGALVNLQTSQFNASLDTIKNNLTYLINKVTELTQTEAAGTSAASGLLSTLSTIKADFNGVSGVSEWVTDYGKGREGDFQRHLNDATVASQSFNDTEREELQRVMFVYEEFYKSATEMLSRLTQVIEKMASAISR